MNPGSRYHLGLLTLLVLITNQGLLGAPPDQRPKIGLALGGGGARGFAHLGVIEWLEDQHVPVDFIAGTSMGGLIGGLYATGMKPSEMRELLEDLDWAALLSPGPSFPDSSFRRKQDKRDFPTVFELGWKGGLALSDALLPGHSIRLLLDHLTVAYSSLESFDTLPIPFRCTAVDLTTGERVVLKDGSLSQALSATMAIPGVFKPVQIDGRLLADGGLLDNLPTTVVKSMGADIVIAVDVGTPLKSREELNYLFNILDQAIGVMMIENVRESRRFADVVISPDLGLYTSSDFKESKPIADLGKHTARQKELILAGLALGETEWDQHLDSRQSRRRRRQPSPELVVARLGPPQASEQVEEELQGYVGETLESHDIESDLNRIYGWGRWSQVGYRVEPGAQGETLIVEALEKSHGPPFINLAFTANNTETDSVEFAIGSRLTFFDIGGYGSEWRVDGTLGSELSAATEYYRPLGHGFFMAPRLFGGRELTNLFEDGERLAQYKTRLVGAGFDLGHGFGGRKNEFRVGFQIADADAEVRLGNPLLPSLSGTVSEAFVRWTHHAQDSPVIPRNGLRAELSGSWFFKSPGSPTGFPRSELRISNFTRLGEKNSFFVRAAGGTSFGKTAPPLQQFTLGGPSRLGGFGVDEFRGSRYLLVGPGYIHEVAELPLFLGRKLYASGWYEMGSVFERGGPRAYWNSVSSGLLAETLLGPVFAGFSWGEGGRHKLYFSLGRLF